MPQYRKGDRFCRKDEEGAERNRDGIKKNIAGNKVTSRQGKEKS